MEKESDAVEAGDARGDGCRRRARRRAPAAADRGADRDVSDADEDTASQPSSASAQGEAGDGGSSDDGGRSGDGGSSPRTPRRSSDDDDATSSDRDDDGSEYDREWWRGGSGRRWRGSRRGEGRALGRGTAAAGRGRSGSRGSGRRGSSGSPPSKRRVVQVEPGSNFNADHPLISLPDELEQRILKGLPAKKLRGLRASCRSAAAMVAPFVTSLKFSGVREPLSGSPVMLERLKFVRHVQIDTSTCYAAAPEALAQDPVVRGLPAICAGLPNLESVALAGLCAFPSWKHYCSQDANSLAGFEHVYRVERHTKPGGSLWKALEAVGAARSALLATRLSEALELASRREWREIKPGTVVNQVVHAIDMLERLGRVGLFVRCLSAVPNVRKLVLEVGSYRYGKEPGVDTLLSWVAAGLFENDPEPGTCAGTAAGAGAAAVAASGAGGAGATPLVAVAAKGAAAAPESQVGPVAAPAARRLPSLVLSGLNTPEEAWCYRLHVCGSALQALSFVKGLASLSGLLFRADDLTSSKTTPSTVRKCFKRLTSLQRLEVAVDKECFAPRNVRLESVEGSSIGGRDLADFLAFHGLADGCGDLRDTASGEGLRALGRLTNLVTLRGLCNLGPKPADGIRALSGLRHLTNLEITYMGHCAVSSACEAALALGGVLGAMSSLRVLDLGLDVWGELDEAQYQQRGSGCVFDRQAEPAASDGEGGRTGAAGAGGAASAPAALTGGGGGLLALQELTLAGPRKERGYTSGSSSASSLALVRWMPQLRRLTIERAGYVSRRLFAGAAQHAALAEVSLVDLECEHPDFLEECLEGLLKLPALSVLHASGAFTGDITPAFAGELLQLPAFSELRLSLPAGALSNGDGYDRFSSLMGPTDAAGKEWELLLDAQRPRRWGLSRSASRDGPDGFFYYRQRGPVEVVVQRQID